MRVPLLHREPPESLPGVTGQVRLGPTVREVLRRINTGDIALIDAVDLDLVTADELIRVGVGAVVNVAASISGRYPALGAARLVEAGVPLLDDVGHAVIGRVSDGDVVRVVGRELCVGHRVIAEGLAQTPESVAAATADAQSGLRAQLEAFAGSSRGFLLSEQALVLDGVGLPPIRAAIEGRPVLVVSRGPRDEADLEALTLWIREERPLLVGVGAGADVLLRAGHTPDLVIGDMDDVSDDALRCGAELVVHGYRDGRALGLDRARVHQLAPVIFEADMTSDDLALLMALHGGASMVVSAGAADSLVELLDRDRAGMTSTVMTRLRLGGLLVDAGGVAQLYRSRLSRWALAFLVLAGLLALAVSVLVTPVGQDWLDGWGN